ncbi:hypothetical protein C6496_18330 [Candidatus Poribacteria bacterium]|nr:MAG: hypothetical protein C6496_18330 [Candidatus Poribacteria bacterium]
MKTDTIATFLLPRILIMKHKSCLLFFLVSIASLCPSLSVVFAKAPATAKIVFAANRVGNREIYLMNPEASKFFSLQIEGIPPRVLGICI